MKFKWKLIDKDLDHCTLQRSFSGKLTHQRQQIVKQYCESNTFNEHCGCEHDCCGHHIGQNMSFTYSKNQLNIQVTHFYNY